MEKQSGSWVWKIWVDDDDCGVDEGEAGGSYHYIAASPNMAVANGKVLFVPAGKTFDEVEQSPTKETEA